MIRLLSEFEAKSEHLECLQNQIQDHEKQFKMCQSVNPKDFALESINGKLKLLILRKLNDKICDLKEKMSENVQFFKQNSQLLSHKLEKCLASDIEDGEMVTFMAEICTKISEFAFKTQFLLENSKVTEDEMDESDAIFKHDLSTSKKKLSYKMDPKDLETIQCKKFF